MKLVEVKYTRRKANERVDWLDRYEHEELSVLGISDSEDGSLEMRDVEKLRAQVDHMLSVHPDPEKRFELPTMDTQGLALNDTDFSPSETFMKAFAHIGKQATGKALLAVINKLVEKKPWENDEEYERIWNKVDETNMRLRDDGKYGDGIAKKVHQAAMDGRKAARI